jgi:hypothetical protein
LRALANANDARVRPAASSARTADEGNEAMTPTTLNVLAHAARHAKEEFMTRHRPTVALCCLLLLAASGGSAAAQQSPSEVQASMQCGGQYECIEDRPLTEAEARASRSHPQFVQTQEQAHVAATPPTASSFVVEQRKGSSVR